MNNPALSLMSSIVIGLGATLTLDLWAWFLKHAFRITPSNYCLVGRWLRNMADRTFKNSIIAASPQNRTECTIGWIAHYIIGILFAIAFVGLAGSHWLQRPTLIPAVSFGVLTVLAPFFIMQPALGLGLAAAKTPRPAQARLRSLMSHTVFGIGLYLFGLLICVLL